MKEKRIISIKDLEKYFGNHNVLDKISVDIDEGSIIGLVGSNGSGKTTFLSILAGLIPNYGGFFEKKKNLSIGALIEEPIFFNHLSGYENLELIAKLNNVSEFSLEHLLKRFDLYENKDKKYGKYSLGMKQRLGIAAAFIASTDLILLDEPTNGLDPIGIRFFREYIKEVSKNNNCIIISSHQINDIELICTHLLVINQGKNLYFGTKANFIDRFKHNNSFEDIIIKLIGKEQNIT